MYAAIPQAKARSGTAEELTPRIKEDVIPIISDVQGFRAYYVVYAPDDADGDRHFQQFRGGRGIKQPRARLDRTEPRTPSHRPGRRGRGAGDRAYVGLERDDL